MGLLISRVGPRVYQIIEDAADYDAALLVLDGQYNRAQNEVSARHALLTRTQRPGETGQEYL